MRAVLEPLLPVRPPQRIGRPRVSDRVAFRAIVLVLLSGAPWRMVPNEIGCSGVRTATVYATGTQPESGSGFTASSCAG
jgi:transposase